MGQGKCPGCDACSGSTSNAAPLVIHTLGGSSDGLRTWIPATHPHGKPRLLVLTPLGDEPVDGTCSVAQKTYIFKETGHLDLSTFGASFWKRFWDHRATGTRTEASQSKDISEMIQPDMFHVGKLRPWEADSLIQGPIKTRSL